MTMSAANGRRRLTATMKLVRWGARISACLAATSWVIAAVYAQQSSGSPLDLLQQMQQMRGGQSGVSQPVTPQQTILEPNAPANPILPRSRLEQLLSTRAGVVLKQFGYDQLGIGRPITLVQAGAAQDNYILGPGDEIVVSLRGQENSEYRATVDRDGRVVLPRLAPVLASGRQFGDFRRDLINAIHRAYVATEGYVTLGRVRQISVLVSGEVNSPGVRTLTGLSTAVDAILISGGVKKTGSLRHVYILRGDRRIPVDLYSVLTTHGSAQVPTLTEGDRLVVPPLGPTVAVVGWVRRPGIFEMAGDRGVISARDLLSLAGGLEVRGKYLFSVLRVAPDGSNQLTALNIETGSIGDSDILFVQPAANETTSRATLSGGTPLAGQYPVSGTKLSQMLKSPGALGANPYTLFGVISRRDPNTLLRTLIPFTPVAVLKGSEDMNVQSDDIVRVISAQEARLLSDTVRRYMGLQQTSEEAQRNPQIPTLPETRQNNEVVPQYPTGVALAQGANNPEDPSNPNYTHERLISQQEPDRLALMEAEHDEEISNQMEMGERKIIIRPGQQNPVVPGQLLPPKPYSGDDSQQNLPNQPLLPDADGYNGQSAFAAGGDLSLQQNPALGMPQQQLLQQQLQQQQQYQRQQRPLPPNLQEEPNLPGQTWSNKEITRLSQLASQLHVDPVVLANFLEDHTVNVDGAVQGPGIFLVGPDAEIQAVVAAAGGMARWADRSAVEVISTSVDPETGSAQTSRRTLSLANGADAAFVVSPRDDVHINEVFTAVGVGSVQIQGQVRHTGTYQIVRGEHLSDLLMRAGGLTDSAYPYGTVFLRRSAAQRERDAFQREASEIENQLLLAMSRRDPNAKLAPDAFTSLQGYVNEIRQQKPLGRVTVVADPTVLAAHPAQDPLLEPGDIIYIPQRPYSVAVLGEVLQPGSVPFKSDLSATDYISRAGGYSQFADSSETILVLPDGSARRVDTSWMNFGSDSIPPGSTIYVARDISGVDLHQIIIDTTQIFSQLATSAAALAVLSKQ